MDRLLRGRLRCLKFNTVSCMSRARITYIYKKRMEVRAVQCIPDKLPIIIHFPRQMQFFLHDLPPGVESLCGCCLFQSLEFCLARECFEEEFLRSGIVVIVIVGGCRAEMVPCVP